MQNSNMFNASSLALRRLVENVTQKIDLVDAVTALDALYQQHQLVKNPFQYFPSECQLAFASEIKQLKG